MNTKERMGSSLSPAGAATVQASVRNVRSKENARSIRRGTRPVAAAGGGIYTVKALWRETGKTELLAVSRKEAIASHLARDWSRKDRWFSAVYVTNGQPGIRAAFKMGRPV